MSNHTSITVQGSQLVGSPVTVDNSVRQQVSATGPVTVGDLRSALDDARAELMSAVDDEDDRVDLEHELAQLDRELAKDGPTAPRVTSRWERVVALVGGVVPVIDKITDLVHRLFGATG